MITIRKIGLTVFILIWSSAGFASDCDPSCQLEQIKSYFSAMDELSRKGSGVDEIDALLALTHDDVEYVHVEYGANFNKRTWREAFIRNLNRGAYQNGPENEIRILKVIYGKNHTAIEYSHGVNMDGKWQGKKPLMVLFGFTDGLISSVIEYW